MAAKKLKGGRGGAHWFKLHLIDEANLASAPGSRWSNFRQSFGKSFQMRLALLLALYLTAHFTKTETGRSFATGEGTVLAVQ